MIIGLNKKIMGVSAEKFCDFFYIFRCCSTAAPDNRSTQIIPDLTFLKMLIRIVFIGKLPFGRIKLAHMRINAQGVSPEWC